MPFLRINEFQATTFADLELAGTVRTHLRESVNAQQLLRAAPIQISSIRRGNRSSTKSLSP
jgi:hypothetical protein